ncbi:MAG: hypothetical protein OJF49_001936 [Ktedonobacterales bacterium]|jgi:hypothetical protein|nr:MAG: hypothetical protein OJF49_001936 [Ktedonobacterales bacterium]
MGVDCHGWVEVRDPTTPATEGLRFPGWWSGVIRMKDIVERNYQVFGYFFDVRNPFETALAGRRGIPWHMSQEALADVIDPNDLPAVSWVLWSEILASDWQSKLTLPPGWSLLFALIEQLAAYYSGDRVRLVIWFDDSIGI